MLEIKIKKILPHKISKLDFACKNLERLLACQPFSHHHPHRNSSLMDVAAAEKMRIRVYYSKEIAKIKNSIFSFQPNVLSLQFVF